MGMGTYFLGRVFSIFSMSLVVAAIGAYFSKDINLTNTFVVILLVIIEFALIFAINALKRNPTLSALLLFGFTFISGLIIGPVIYTFFQFGASGLVFEALGITAGIFLFITAIVYIFHIDLTRSRIGVFLMMALFGIIVVSIVNLFLRNPAIYFWISSITVVVFSGFVLYDISRILNNPQIENEYMAALQLYLDFYNIFINLLNILGIVRTRK